jgi:hypothetical protein
MRGESQTWPAVNERPFLSEGHGLRNSLATVRANASAREPYEKLGPATVLPPGSVLVESLVDPRSSRAAELYVMEKLSSGTWRFFVVSHAGTTNERTGIKLCQRCHAEAVADSLFGVPHARAPEKNGRPDRHDLPGLRVEKEEAKSRSLAPNTRE